MDQVEMERAKAALVEGMRQAELENKPWKKLAREAAIQFLVWGPPIIATVVGTGVMLAIKLKK